MDRIFIQIASYCDPELGPTLLDCLEKANRPNQLTFGLCWQHREEELPAVVRSPQFRWLDVPAVHSRGACWARNLIQHRLYQGEEFTLQLDSHHRFLPGWDDLLLDMFGTLQARGHSKPVLTSYAPGYEPGRIPEYRVDVPRELELRSFREDGSLAVAPTALRGFPQVQAPPKARFFSAHMAFAEGRFCREVQHDPDLYFTGEELNLAVRSFTHGYDLFTPHKVLLYHHYTRAGAFKHWDDYRVDNGAANNWWDIQEVESRKMQNLLSGVTKGLYGLGRERTVNEYERFAGLSFSRRAVEPGRWSAGRTLHLPEEQWLAGLLPLRRIDMLLPVACEGDDLTVRLKANDVVLKEETVPAELADGQRHLQIDYHGPAQVECYLQADGVELRLEHRALPIPH